MTNKPLSARAADAAIEDFGNLAYECFDLVYPTPPDDIEIVAQFQHHLRYPSGHIAAALMLANKEGCYKIDTFRDETIYNSPRPEERFPNVYTSYYAKAASPELALLAAIAKSKGC